MANPVARLNGHLCRRGHRVWLSPSHERGLVIPHDVAALGALEIEEIILALFAVRRLDLVSCPVFYAN